MSEIPRSAVDEIPAAEARADATSSSAGSSSPGSSSPGSSPAGSSSAGSSSMGSSGAAPSRSRGVHWIPWLLAGLCFYSAYAKVAARAATEGLSAVAYVARFFQDADWGLWLLTMIPYSCFFFLVDALAVTTVVRWFNAPVRYADILPVRASSYILAIINEQVGKGAMALYLKRRNGVAGWEVGSSMVLIAIAELYQLLTFSALGTFLNFDLIEKAASRPGALPLDWILPLVFTLAAIYAPLHLWFFSGRGGARSATLERFRNRPIFLALRRARLRNYLILIAIKAPNLILAVAVYTISLSLFNVDVRFGQLMAFLPVIFLAAAIPLPFHAGALVLWQVLFPEFPQVGIFSLVMHTFFVAFNAVIGLFFLPRANRELFG